MTKKIVLTLLTVVTLTLTACEGANQVQPDFADNPIVKENLALGSETLEESSHESEVADDDFVYTGETDVYESFDYSAYDDFELENADLTDKAYLGAKYSDVSVEDAIEIFLAEHPTATVEFTKLQGGAEATHYYVMGTDDVSVYKMHIRQSNGEILLDKAIPKNGYTDYVAENTADSPSSGAISEEEAKAVFLKQHSGAAVEVVKLQGGGQNSHYYIMGTLNSSLYKMHIRQSNGEILMDKEIALRGNRAQQKTPAVQQETPAATPEQESTTPPAADSSSLSEQDAQAVFSNYHPSASISFSKLEGNAYYVEGTQGNDIVKMKIGKDGSVYLNKTITRGAGNRGAGNRGGYGR